MIDRVTHIDPEAHQVELAAFIKERVALRGSVWGTRHVGVAVSGAKRQ